MRKSWEEIWMEICAVLAQRSTCFKRQVAAVIVDQNNRSVSMGFNGTPAGSPHCCDQKNHDPVAHREWSKCNEVHAEMNALLYLTRYPQVYEPEHATLYTLLSPCIECAKAIHVAGIRRVVVRDKYDDIGLKYLTDHRVKVEFLT